MACRYMHMYTQTHASSTLPRNRLISSGSGSCGRRRAETGAGLLSYDSGGVLETQSPGEGEGQEEN